MNMDFTLEETVLSMLCCHVGEMYFVMFLCCHVGEMYFVMFS